MKKTFIVLSIFLVFALVGCGSEVASVNAAKTETESAESEELEVEDSETEPETEELQPTESETEQVAEDEAETEQAEQLEPLTDDMKRAYRAAVLEGINNFTSSWGNFDGEDEPIFWFYDFDGNGFQELLVSPGYPSTAAYLYDGEKAVPFGGATRPGQSIVPTPTPGYYMIYTEQDVDYIKIYGLSDPSTPIMKAENVGWLKHLQGDDSNIDETTYTIGDTLVDEASFFKELFEVTGIPHTTDFPDADVSNWTFNVYTEMPIYTMNDLDEILPE